MSRRYIVESLDKEFLNVESRLGAVEASYDRLHNDVRSLDDKFDTKFSAIDTKIDHLYASMTSQLNELMGKRAEAQKPQWGSIFAGVSILITVAVLAFAPVYTNLGDHKTELVRHEDILDTRADRLGRIETRLDEMDQGLTELDVILQREMRLLDDTMNERLKNVDILGRERHKQQDIEINNLKREYKNAQEKKL